MAKKNKKKFKISRDDLNIKIDEYLKQGGMITNKQNGYTRKSKNGFWNKYFN